MFSSDTNKVATYATRNLGVIFNNHLKKIQTVKSYIPKFILETLVHGFITSWIDFFNSLFFKLANNSLRKLQTVQDACARLLTGTKQSDC